MRVFGLTSKKFLLICVVLLLSSVSAGTLFADEKNAPAQPVAGAIRGVTRHPGGLLPLPGARVIVHSVEENTDRTVVSGDDGAFLLENLVSGRYQLLAGKAGFGGSAMVSVDLPAGGAAQADLTLGQQASAPSSGKQKQDAGGFLHRFFKAYADDWKGSAGSSPAPEKRGYPQPLTTPPYPFADWPYGGSVDIGAQWTQASPLMEAIWSGPHGDVWKKSGIQIYGWLNFGFNVSTSDKKNLGRYTNFPEAYAEVSNSIQPDQQVLYIERQPDTVQTDHFDWGFRLSNLYGIDYRFTAAKGYFSQQLLQKNYEYGYDPVMAYVDLYWGQVAQGLNIRIGRYISIPDIEAQLAPNNYTYSHSLLYTFDCYTQTGLNATVKLSDHWLVQAGVSPGCDTTPWNSRDAKLTGNFGFQYTWNNGNDSIYPVLNAINDEKYAYNNLNAMYVTWYHKFRSHPSWHSSTEYWYMWEKQVPNVTNPAAASLLEGGANGAVCKNTTQLTCYAPETAIVNYLEKELSKKNYISIRNEFFDDMKGQRTGFKSRYSEHLLGLGHWIGTTILLRPELRYERSYDATAYDNGTKKNQFTIAGDIIYFF